MVIGLYIEVVSAITNEGEEATSYQTASTGLDDCQPHWYHYKERGLQAAGSYTAHAPEIGCITVQGHVEDPRVFVLR